MTFRDFKKLVAMDGDALISSSGNERGLLVRLFTDFNTQVMFFFRLCTYLKSKKLRALGLFFPVLLWYRHIMAQTGIQLHPCTAVGGGLVFMHSGSVIINPDSIIGENVLIIADVIIGSVRTDNGSRAPIIGRRVVIGAGARIIGGVKIGDNVCIGAGAVVVKDIPDNAVAAGNPATVLNYNGATVVSRYLGPDKKA